MNEDDVVPAVPVAAVSTTVTPGIESTTMPYRRSLRTRLVLLSFMILIGCLVGRIIFTNARTRRTGRREMLLRLSERSQANNAASDAEGSIDTTAPLVHDAAATHHLPIQTMTLPNGLRVVILEDHRLPKVTIGLRIDAGDAYESIDSKRGVAVVTATLLMEGGAEDDRVTPSGASANLSIPAANQTSLVYGFEDRGGEITPSQTQDYDMFTGSGFSDQVVPLLQLMGDRIQHLDTFSSSELNHTLAEVEVDASHNFYAADLEGHIARTAFYEGTHYAIPYATSQQVHAITRKNVLKFYRAYYRPDSAILGIEGDVDPKTLLATIRTAFGGWQRPDSKPSDLPDTNFTPLHERRVHLIDWPQENKTILSVRALVADPKSRDMPALYVANQILGATSAGRFFQNLREEQEMTYGSYATFDEQRGGSIWRADATVSNANAGEAVAGILAGIHDLQNRQVGPNELTRAKNSIIGRLILQEQTPGTQMGGAVTAMGDGLPPNTWRTFLKQIDKVTPADVQSVTRNYLRDDGLQIIAVGPARQISSDMSAFGPITQYNARGDKVFW